MSGARASVAQSLPTAWCSPRLAGEPLVVPGRDWFVVDVETTGLNPAADRLTEFAVVQLGPDGEQRSVASWVERDGDAKLVAIAEEARSRLAEGVLVAHNARFDLAFIDSDPRTSAMLRRSRRWLCTLNLGRRVTLAERAAAEGVEVIDPHTALGDATTLALIFRSMLRRADQRGFSTVAGIPVATREVRRSPSASPAPTEGGWPAVLLALPMVVPVRGVTRDQRDAFRVAARGLGEEGPLLPGDTDEVVALFREVGLTRIDLLRLLEEAALLSDLIGWQDAAVGQPVAP